MTQYGDNKCLDCEHNRKCYMRSIRANECGVEFVCKKEEDKKIEPLNVGIFEETPYFASNGEIMAIKINEIIDYINKENK